MKLGQMDLSKVPLAAGAESANTTNDLAQRIFEAWLGQLQAGSAAPEKSQTQSLKEMLELMKLMRELQGHGEAPSAKDSGFSDMAKVFQTMMEQQFTILKELTLNKDQGTPKESEIEQQIKQIGLQMLLQRPPDPATQMKEHLDDLVALQQMMEKVAPKNHAPTLEEQLRLKQIEAEIDNGRKRLELEIEKLKLEQQARLQETDNSRVLYDGAFSALNNFIQSRRAQAGLSPQPEAMAPQSRTAAAVSPPTATFHRLKCPHCGTDTLITGASAAFCPACGNALPEDADLPGSSDTLPDREEDTYDSDTDS